MRAIFISYRREDAEGQAGRLFDDLTEHFGKDTVFMDVAAIEPGRDFRRAIDDHVASCGVLLAMIGKSWLDAADSSGRRRLENPMDFVRLETASALKRDIPVVPVLVHGAGMPRPDQLPADLAELAYRNAVELTHARWDSDVQLLIKALSPYVASRQENASRADVASPDVPRTAAAPPVAAARPAKRRLPRIVAGAAAAVVIAIGAYAWQQRSSEDLEAGKRAQTKAAAEADAQRRADEQRRALEAKKLAERKAAAEADARRRAEEERQALEAKKEAERKAAAEADAQRRAQERRALEARLAQARELAAQRVLWRSYKFPPPNGGLLVYKIMPDGNPACASYDGATCLWGVTRGQIDFGRLKPLVCGPAHRARWGASGYEDPKHWCSLAKIVRGNPS